MKRLLVLVLLAACNPRLEVQSPAPPGRTARLDRVEGFWSLHYYKLELSAGVALAVTCDYEGPCAHVKATSEDPNIAEVRPASLGVLQAALAGDRKTAAALVFVGKTPGSTTIHVRSDEGVRDVVVTVVAPPSATL